jgi:hypothetical protein
MQQLPALIGQGAFVMEAPDFPADRVVMRTILAPSRNLLAPAALMLCAGLGWAGWGFRAALELGAALARFAQARLPEFEGGAERIGRVTCAASGIALEAAPVLHLVERGTVARIPLSLLHGWRVEGAALLVETAERSWRIPLADPARWARLLVDRCGPSPLG